MLALFFNGIIENNRTFSQGFGDKMSSNILLRSDHFASFESEKLFC